MLHASGLIDQVDRRLLVVLLVVQVGFCLHGVIGMLRLRIAVLVATARSVVLGTDERGDARLDLFFAVDLLEFRVVSSL